MELFSTRPTRRHVTSHLLNSLTRKQETPHIHDKGVRSPELAPARAGRTDFGRVAGPQPVPSAVNKLGNAVIDWDLILRETNRWYDRVVSALKAPSYAGRATQVDRISNDLTALGKKLDSPGSWLGTIMGGRAAISRLYGNTLVCLLLPASLHVHEISCRAVTLSDLGLIGFALAAHRAERGTYPRQLDDLVPHYLPSVPDDPFANHPFRCKPEEYGFLLYSLGPNQKDNGGRLDSQGSATYEQEEADDYRLQVPPK